MMYNDLIPAVSTTNFDKKLYPDWQAAFDKARELGFRCIDLIMFEDWLTVNPSSLSLTGETLIIEMRDYLERFDMEIVSINARFSDDIAVRGGEAWLRVKQDFLDVLGFARSMNISHITVQPGSPVSGELPGATMARLKDRLLIMSKAAEDAGVTLALEGHKDSLLEDPLVLRAFLEELFPRVSLTFDSSHLVMQGYQIEGISYLLDYSSLIHLRDAALNEMQAPAGEGLTDFYSLFRALEERHFRGVLSLEYFDNYDRNHDSLLKLKEML